MEYKEYRPETGKQFIKLYWSLRQKGDESDGLPEPVLPDGCIEVIFDISDRFVQYFENGKKEIQPRSIIAGQMTSGILIGPTGDTDLFGIRFQPSGAYPLLGFSAIELTDRIEDLKSVIGNDESLLFEKMSETGDFEQRINIFHTYFFSKLSSLRKWPCEVDPVVKLITQNSGSLPISQIARDLQWSERRMERYFREYVGLTPKLFTRITRFQALMQMLENLGVDEIHDHLFEAGYYDQSHMIRDFREFTGRSPLAFMKEQHRISEYFISGEMSDSYNT